MRPTGHARVRVAGACAGGGKMAGSRSRERMTLPVRRAPPGKKQQCERHQGQSQGKDNRPAGHADRPARKQRGERSRTGGDCRVQRQRPRSPRFSAYLDCKRRAHAQEQRGGQALKYPASKQPGIAGRKTAQRVGEQPAPQSPAKDPPVSASIPKVTHHNHQTGVHKDVVDHYPADRAWVHVESACDCGQCSVDSTIGCWCTGTQSDHRKGKALPASSTLRMHLSSDCIRLQAAWSYAPQGARVARPCALPRVPHGPGFAPCRAAKLRRAVAAGHRADRRQVHTAPRRAPRAHRACAPRAT